MAEAQSRAPKRRPVWHVLYRAVPVDRSQVRPPPLVAAKHAEWCGCLMMRSCSPDASRPPRENTSDYVNECEDGRPIHVYDIKVLHLGFQFEKEKEGETILTKRQANTCMALGAAIILTQVLCSFLTLRDNAATRKANSELLRLLAVTDTGEVSRAGAAEPGPALSPGSASLAPARASMPVVADQRIVFPEEDIRNARQRVGAAKAELHKATNELDNLTRGGSPN